MAEGLLGDLLVVEVSTGVAGGYCCSLLSSLGAEVVRVRHPDNGRTEVPPGRTGLPYIREGTRSVTLDVSKPEGVELLRRLAGHADVLMADGDLPLPYEVLSRQNPRLVLVRVAEASNGDDFGRCLTGLNAFAATLLSLVNMSIFGRGQEVEVDGEECLASAAFVVERGREIAWPKTGGDEASLPFKVFGQVEGIAPAPSPGEHNDEVYCGLMGLSGEELARLKEASVI
jgi:crotonobetainyl-CoA:carnitine CoA-transferase CaiB-like acyl-CoA transferase